MKLSATTKDYLQTGRFYIPYRVYGNGNSYLVCLNGIQQSMSMWLSFISYFSPRYRIVLFDYPGQGKAHVTEGPTNISLEE